MSDQDQRADDPQNRRNEIDALRGTRQTPASDRLVLAEAFRKAERQKAAVTESEPGVSVPGAGGVGVGRQVGTNVTPTLKREFPADAAFGAPRRGGAPQVPSDPGRAPSALAFEEPRAAGSGAVSDIGTERLVAALQRAATATTSNTNQAEADMKQASAGSAPGPIGKRSGEPMQDAIAAEVLGRVRRPAEARKTDGAASGAVAESVAADNSVDRISSMREPRLLSFEDLEQKRIMHPAHPQRQAVERFRDLRTRILQISKGRNFALVVSSAVNNGGASFVAINLAAAFSFDSSKTALLIDCNLRYPSLHHAFDMIPELGVTDYLDDPRMDIASIIYPTGIRRLRFVPAGKRKEATADYFTSQRMKQFLTSVRERYPDRFIILDTPSINESPDASILAELADYALIVAPHGKVRQARVVEACARIARDKLLGVVVNN